MDVCGSPREGLEINRTSILDDRHGALVIYPEEVRNIEAFAADKAKRVLKTEEKVPIEELISHTLPNGQFIIIAIFPFRRKGDNQRRNL